MRKILPIILIVAVLVACFVMGVFEGRSEDALSISFYVEDNPGFSDYAAEILFDHTALTLTDITGGEKTKGLFYKNIDGCVAGTMNGTDITGDGVLLTASFQVIDESVAGKYKVSANVYSCYNEKGEEVALSVPDVYVTIAGDGSVSVEGIE